MNAIVDILQTRPSVARQFRASDGAALAFRHWPAKGGVRQKAVILLHRGHEHGARMAHLVDECAMRGADFYALDMRGHGNSRGAGQPEAVADLSRDLDSFVRHLRGADGVEADGIVLVGQSVGAVVATAWVHDYAPAIRGLVLAAPAFDVNLRVPLALPALRLGTMVKPDLTVRSRVTPDELTGDPDRAASYAADPMVSADISARLLIDLHDTAGRLVADASAIAVPVQVLIPGADRIVRAKAATRFFEALTGDCHEAHHFPDLRHDILGERKRAPVVARLRSFLVARFDAHGQPRRDATQIAKTRARDTRRLQRPLPLLSLRGLGWRVMKILTHAGATLSRGLALGRETGFDSGATLDYVYRNQAQGTGPVGRLIDRHYLNAVGWRGIRQRKVHLEELIGAALGKLDEAGRPLNVADIAAGHGRYVLDALDRQRAVPAQVVLRDFCAANVASGRDMIAARGVQDRVRFEQGDAFDTHAVATLDPRPSLAIVSGLYELFDDNDLVRGSLAGLGAAVARGDYLIYTNQPWHPQLELIARTLTSHKDGKPWVMRCRPQAEMDQLVEEAGFRKIDQRIDRWGIFTVSLAQRV